MVIKFSKEDIQNITLFENLTKASVVDHISTKNTYYFIINGKSLGEVIGKNGFKIKRIEEKIRKDIKIFKYSNRIEEFVKNIVSVPVKKIEIIEKGDKKIVKVSVDKKDRPLVVGKEGNNIKIIKEFLRREHSIDDIILGD
jgi:NusA-like KH domain protein